MAMETRPTFFAKLVVVVVAVDVVVDALKQVRG